MRMCWSPYAGPRIWAPQTDVSAAEAMRSAPGVGKVDASLAADAEPQKVTHLQKTSLIPQIGVQSPQKTPQLCKNDV